MVSNTGRTSDTRRIRRLKSPNTVEIDADANFIPLRLRFGAGWRSVFLARTPWRIDQHWWRADAVQRTYYRIELEDGPPLTIYYDEIAKTWFRQEY